LQELFIQCLDGTDNEAFCAPDVAIRSGCHGCAIAGALAGENCSVAWFTVLLVLWSTYRLYIGYLMLVPNYFDPYLWCNCNVSHYALV
jgi:hypothetical protein